MEYNVTLNAKNGETETVFIVAPNEDKAVEYAMNHTEWNYRDLDWADVQSA